MPENAGRSCRDNAAVEGWAVEALIVVDQELATPYLRRPHMRVVPLEYLRSLVAPSRLLA